MTRTFTLEQANATLPLVSRIVADIVTLHGEWTELMQEHELVSSGARAGRDDATVVALQRRMQQTAADIDACLQELLALGIEFKDYALGLVDFPGERDGRPIYLCWRLGESSVRFWHEMDAGFAGRQPIEPAAR